jgi:hypothetical protein
MGSQCCFRACSIWSVIIVAVGLMARLSLLKRVANT